MAPRCASVEVLAPLGYHFRIRILLATCGARVAGSGPSAPDRSWTRTGDSEQRGAPPREPVCTGMEGTVGADAYRPACRRSGRAGWAPTCVALLHACDASAPRMRLVGTSADRLRCAARHPPAGRDLRSGRMGASGGGSQRTNRASADAVHAGLKAASTQIASRDSLACRSDGDPGPRARARKPPRQTGWAVGRTHRILATLCAVPPD